MMCSDSDITCTNNQWIGLLITENSHDTKFESVSFHGLPILLPVIYGGHFDLNG